MTAFRRHRSRDGRKPVFRGDFPPGDSDITETIRAVQPEWDGATFGLPVPAGTTPFSGASDIGLPGAGNPPGSGYFSGIGPGNVTWHPGQYPPDPAPRTEPPARLRARPPQQPPPAGYSATTGPMPALSRPAVSIGDALAHDDHWGPKLTPRPCGHCGTPPEIPAGILDRTRIIGHVNWLAGQAGWKYDVDIILTCPPCQQDDGWKARQGQVEVRWPDGGYCVRHDDGAGDRCDCPGAVLAVDVMLASEDHLGSGRGGHREVTR